MADPSTRIFRASLRGRLYRDLELPSAGSLEDLAAAIVGAFGFDLDHAFGFYGGLGHRYHDAEERYELFADLGQADEGVRGVRRTKLGAAFPEVGKKMLFLFDYGDEWRFKVEVNGVGGEEAEDGHPPPPQRGGGGPAQYT